MHREWDLTINVYSCQKLYLYVAVITPIATHGHRASNKRSMWYYYWQMVRIACHSVALVALCTWWRHQMETFSALLAFCTGNSPVTGQWRGTLKFSLICAWINGWVNNHKAGDFRRYCAHYDVIAINICIVMHMQVLFSFYDSCPVTC